MLNRGERYGRLVVMGDAGLDDNGLRRYRCICDCGTEVTVYGGNLRSGMTRSCGCLRKERLAVNRFRGKVQTMDPDRYREACRHNRSGWCDLKDRQCGSFSCARMRHYRKVKGE